MYKNCTPEDKCVFVKEKKFVFVYVFTFFLLLDGDCLMLPISCTSRNQKDLLEPFKRLYIGETSIQTQDWC